MTDRIRTAGRTRGQATVRVTPGVIRAPTSPVGDGEPTVKVRLGRVRMVGGTAVRGRIASRMGLTGGGALGPTASGARPGRVNSAVAPVGRAGLIVAVEPDPGESQTGRRVQAGIDHRAATTIARRRLGGIQRARPTIVGRDAAMTGRPGGAMTGHIHLSGHTHLIDHAKLTALRAAGRTNVPPVVTTVDRLAGVNVGGVRRLTRRAGKAIVGRVRAGIVGHDVLMTGVRISRAIGGRVVMTVSRRSGGTGRRRPLAIVVRGGRMTGGRWALTVPGPMAPAHPGASMTGGSVAMTVRGAGIGATWTAVKTGWCRPVWNGPTMSRTRPNCRRMSNYPAR